MMTSEKLCHNLSVSAEFSSSAVDVSAKREVPACGSCVVYLKQLKLARELLKSEKEFYAIRCQKYADTYSHVLIRVAAMKRELDGIKSLMQDLTGNNNKMLARVQGTLYMLEGVMKQTDRPDLSQILCKVTKMNMRLEDENEQLSQELGQTRVVNASLLRQLQTSQQTIATMKAEFSSCQQQRQKCEDMKLKLQFREDQIKVEQREATEQRCHSIDMEKEIERLQKELKEKQKQIFILRGNLFDTERQLEKEKSKSCSSSLPQSSASSVSSELSLGSDPTCNQWPTPTMDLQCCSSPLSDDICSSLPPPPKAPRLSHTLSLSTDEKQQNSECELKLKFDSEIAQLHQLLQLSKITIDASQIEISDLQQKLSDSQQELVRQKLQTSVLQQQFNGKQNELEHVHNELEQRHQLLIEIIHKTMQEDHTFDFVASDGSPLSALVNEEMLLNSSRSKEYSSGDRSYVNSQNVGSKWRSQQTSLPNQLVRVKQEPLDAQPCQQHRHREVLF